MVDVVSRFGRSPFQQLAEMADLLVRIGQQACDLAFQGARVNDLAQRSIRCQRQQISRDVEGTRPHSALVGFLLHVRWPGGDFRQITKHRVRVLFVFGKETVNRLLVESACRLVTAEIRRVVAAFLEILVAS